MNAQRILLAIIIATTISASACRSPNDLRLVSSQPELNAGSAGLINSKLQTVLAKKAKHSDSDPDVKPATYHRQTVAATRIANSSKHREQTTVVPGTKSR